MSLHKYGERFTQLLKYVPSYQQDKNLKVRKFIMGLNNRIGVAVDVLAPQTMEEALKSVVRQLHKLKRDDSIQDNKRKSSWNTEGSQDPTKSILRTSSPLNQSPKEMVVKNSRVTPT